VPAIATAGRISPITPIVIAITVARLTSSHPSLSESRIGCYQASAIGTDGSEPWRTNGTTTEQVADLNPGPGNSFETGGSTGNRTSGGFTELDGLLYFAASDVDIGADDLWRTDGTTTVQVQANSAPVSFTKFGGSLYFAAAGPDGRELWRVRHHNQERLAAALDQLAKSDHGFETLARLRRRPQKRTAGRCRP